MPAQRGKEGLAGWLEIPCTRQLCSTSCSSSGSDSLCPMMALGFQAQPIKDSAGQRERGGVT